MEMWLEIWTPWARHIAHFNSRNLAKPYRDPYQPMRQARRGRREILFLKKVQVIPRSDGEDNVH